MYSAIRLKGLGDTGHCSYMNSGLQSILIVPRMVTLLDSLPAGKPLTDALRGVLDRLRAPDETPVLDSALEKFWAEVVGCGWVEIGRVLPVDFLRFLLDEITREHPATVVRFKGEVSGICGCGHGALLPVQLRVNTHNLFTGDGCYVDLRAGLASAIAAQRVCGSCQKAQQRIVILPDIVVLELDRSGALNEVAGVRL